MEAITKEMMINDIITSHPYLAEYIMDYGVHCIGCGASAYETLEEGFMGHGMSDEEVDEVIKKLNIVIRENEKDTTKHTETDSKELFKITPEAAKKIKEFAEKEKKPGSDFRIRVMKEGCSGFQYYFGFDNKPKSDDIIFEEHGVKILIDKESIDKIKNSILKYYETLGGSGFSLENPNVKNA